MNATATLRLAPAGGSGGAASGVVEKTGAPSSQASPDEPHDLLKSRRLLEAKTSRHASMV